MRQVGPANPDLITIHKLCMPGTGLVMAKPGNPVLADNHRPVKADEPHRVEPRLKGANRLVEEVAALAHMKPHIIALGIDPFDVIRSDADQFGPVRDPEFVHRIGRRNIASWNPATFDDTVITRAALTRLM